MIKVIRESVQNGNIDDLTRQLEKYPNSYLSKLLSSAMAEYQNGISSDSNNIKQLVNNELIRSKTKIAYNLKKHLNNLLSIGITTPLIGLLAAILIIYKAFHWMGTTDAPVHYLFWQISNAPEEVGFGLIVGLPSIWCYFWLQTKAEKIIAEMEIISIEILNLVNKRL